MILADKILQNRPQATNEFDGCPKFVSSIEIHKLALGLLEQKVVEPIELLRWSKFPYTKFWVEWENAFGVLVEGSGESFKFSYYDHQTTDFKPILGRGTFTGYNGSSYYTISIPNPKELPFIMKKIIIPSMGVLSTTLVFMNCRNLLKIQDVQYIPKNNAQKRLFKRRPLVSYSLVSIRQSPLIKKIYESDPSGNKVRAHLVRGHFKRRKSGIYWWVLL